ncbi:hypothetical protein NXX33_01225 [Bacteroides fragilis]|nr:hypothetical protein [Bacteroides fragilis]
MIRATIGAIKVSIGAIRAGIGVFKANAVIVKYFHKQNLEKKQEKPTFQTKGVLV